VTDRPLVSVALATCNGERFLREQLDSIYAQTYPRIEVVASDDGSTDGTVQILEEYRLSKGLSYTVQPGRLGLVGNFERAISSCSGDFIVLSDQDDIWEPDKLESLLAAIGGCSLVYSDAALIDGQGAVLAPSLLKASRVTPAAGRPFQYLVCNACVTGCTALFTRELSDQALPVPDGEPYHDWWLSIAATRLGGIAYVDRPLVRYRQHAENYAGAYMKKGILERLFRRFTRGTRERMRAKNELLLRRTRVYMESRESLRLSDAEFDFLADIHRYARGMTGSGSRLRVPYLALKRRAELFPEDALPVQVVKACARFFRI